MLYLLFIDLFDMENLEEIPDVVRLIEQDLVGSDIFEFAIFVEFGKELRRRWNCNVAM